ncbi:MAG: hypothetical protein KDB27_24915 [Planctomycetales bacterium]|nr:hypothetical protein [Planctomycetales bacterium]
MDDIPPVNPFQAPTSDQPHGQIVGDNETAQLLSQTRPWTLTIGILMIIGSAFMVLGGLGMVVMSLAGAGGAAGPQVFGLTAIGVFYLVIAALYVIPAMLLLKYSRRISDYVGSPTVSNLNAAIGAQKSFWRFCGIAALLLIVVYVVGIVIAVVFATMAAQP